MFPKLNPKLFDDWNVLKKEVQESNKNKKVYFKEWEVWWITLWQNIWQESYWKWENYRRPVLILRKLSSNSCICIPLSSKEKTGTWFCDTMLDWIKRTALLYQIKMVDKKRFQRKIWELPENDFWEIKKRLKQLLNL